MIFGKSKKNKPDAENGSSELSENRADDGGLQSAAETPGGYFRRLKDQLSKPVKPSPMVSIKSLPAKKESMMTCWKNSKNY